MSPVGVIRGTALADLAGLAAKRPPAIADTPYGPSSGPLVAGTFAGRDVDVGFAVLGSNQWVAIEWDDLALASAAKDPAAVHARARTWCCASARARAGCARCTRVRRVRAGVRARAGGCSPAT